MRWEDNQGADRPDSASEPIKTETETPERFTDGSDAAKKVYEELRRIRERLDTLKKKSGQTSSRDTSSFDAEYRRKMEERLDSMREEAEKREKEESRRQAVRAQKERQKAIRDAQKAEQRRLKAEREEARRKERQERDEIRRKEREIRAEVRRKKKLADRTAQMGGGEVNIHGTQVTTEIQPVARYSLRDLLGLSTRKERKEAAREGKLDKLQQRQEEIAAEARQAAEHLSRIRASKFRNSSMGRRMTTVRIFSETHKAPLLIILSLVLLIAVGVAGVFNYCTLYEYSYNGHALGYVKNKDDVLRITDMVQRALTEDKDIEVIIDEKDDISFRRVSSLDKDILPDSSDEVLRRLTYMGDLNVKAWGIYVNGDKVGAVQKKTQAADVLKAIEERYASGKKGAEIQKAEILETVEVKKSNTNLRNVSSVDEMTDILCTSGKKETVHTIVAGETLKDIADTYRTTEENLVADNEGVDPHKLNVGETLLIRQNAPLLTVRITEQRIYEHTVKYKTIEKKTDEMYEGEEEIKQEGKNGKEEVTERMVSINGEIGEDGITVLNREVEKKAVNKIVLVGTAERPPSVGDGKYIWPLAGSYTVTSRFGHRWGRHHDGIDLGTPTGNDVRAADGGIVTRAGYFGGYGYCIDIDHQNGQSTRYGHLSRILVSPGQEVYEGEHIAESGNTGRSTGPHLHFEIRIGGTPRDPLAYLP